MKRLPIQNSKSNKFAKRKYTETASNKISYESENKENISTENIPTNNIPTKNASNNINSNDIAWFHDITHDKFYVSIRDPKTSIKLPKYDFFEVNCCPSKYVEVIKFKNDYNFSYEESPLLEEDKAISGNLEINYGNSCNDDPEDELFDIASIDSSLDLQNEFSNSHASEEICKEFSIETIRQSIEENKENIPLEKNTSCDLFLYQAYLRGEYYDTGYGISDLLGDTETSHNPLG